MSIIQVVQKVAEGYRLPPPPGCPEAVYTLMIDCWWVLTSGVEHYSIPHLSHRNPTQADRPTFQKILLTLLGDDKALLAVPTEERATHSLAGVLGSPLEAGHGMYLTRQQSYLTT